MDPMRWHGNYVKIDEDLIIEESHLLDCIAGTICVCTCTDCVRRGNCYCKKCSCSKILAQYR